METVRIQQNWDLSRVFLTVAYTSSYTVGANSPILAQTIVTRQLPQLEKDLGSRLLVRNLSGIHPT